MRREVDDGEQYTGRGEQQPDHQLGAGPSGGRR